MFLVRRNVAIRVCRSRAVEVRHPGMPGVLSRELLTLISTERKPVCPLQTLKPRNIWKFSSRKLIYGVQSLYPADIRSTRSNHFPLRKRTGEAPPRTWTGHFGLLSPHASIYRPGETGGREGEAATDARYSKSDETVICDGGTERDPLAAVREREDAIREQVVEGKDDDLAAWGRVLLALAHDRRPDPDDLQRLGLPNGGGGDGEYQRALEAPAYSARPDPGEVARQVRRVLEAATGGEKPQNEP